MSHTSPDSYALCLSCFLSIPCASPFPTTPHAVENLANSLALHRLAIHKSCTPVELTRRNIGACEVFRRSYIAVALCRGRVGTRSLDHALRGEFERKFWGGRRCNKGSGAC